MQGRGNARLESLCDPLAGNRIVRFYARSHAARSAARRRGIRECAPDPSFDRDRRVRRRPLRCHHCVGAQEACARYGYRLRDWSASKGAQNGSLFGPLALDLKQYFPWLIQPSYFSMAVLLAHWPLAMLDASANRCRPVIEWLWKRTARGAPSRLHCVNPFVRDQQAAHRKSGFTAARGVSTRARLKHRYASGTAISTPSSRAP